VESEARWRGSPDPCPRIQSASTQTYKTKNIAATDLHKVRARLVRRRKISRTLTGKVKAQLFWPYHITREITFYKKASTGLQSLLINPSLQAGVS
jgi:hypothetical protein